MINKFLFLISLSLFGCVAVKQDVASTTKHPIPFQINYSRAHLSGTDYELFKSVGDRVFLECGEIRLGKTRPRDQKFFNLDPQLATELAELQEKLLFLTEDELSRLDPPGKSDQFFDPGEIHLELKTLDTSKIINTSLDSVANLSGQNEKIINRFIKILRAHSIPCGRRDFFGLNL